MSMPTTSGSEEMTSTISAFKIGEAGNVEIQDMVSHPLLMALKQALGDDQFNAYFGTGNDLQGFNPTGQVEVNGVTVDESSINYILNQTSSMAERSEFRRYVRKFRDLISSESVTNIQIFGNQIDIDIKISNPTLQARKNLELEIVKAIHSKILIECDFNNEDSIIEAARIIKKEWGTIDFIVHAVAFADKSELNGRYVDTTKDNFINCLEISCFSLTSLARSYEPIMNDGGSILTLTFYGSNKVIPNYNLMGIAKAALETSVKYLSVDLGTKNIRVNAISAGPMRTLAGAAISNARDVYNYTQKNSALKQKAANK